MITLSFRKLAAEFMGTFLLVFLGCGAALTFGGKDGAALATAIAFGVALMLIYFFFAAVSGANCNPSVSVALAMTNQMSYTTCLAYIVAQCLGAITAAIILALLFGTASGLGAAVGRYTKTNPWKAIVIETILTFILVLAVLATVSSKKYLVVAGFVIGFALLVGVLVGYEWTGGALNSARALGPALFTGNMGTFYIYLIGPILGGILAALVYWYLFVPSEVCGGSEGSFGCPITIQGMS